jgi:hypothetical protein
MAAYMAANQIRLRPRHPERVFLREGSPATLHARVPEAGDPSRKKTRSG